MAIHMCVAMHIDNLENLFGALGIQFNVTDYVPTQRHSVRTDNLTWNLVVDWYLRKRHFPVETNTE